MNKNYLLGLDIGGTKIECALIQISDSNNSPDFTLSTSLTGEQQATILTRKRIPTDRQSGYETVIKNIAKLCSEVLTQNEINANDLHGIGIGLPGSVHPATQMMLNGNTGIFIGKNIAKDLNQLLNSDINIVLENDANLFALSEVLCGVGQDFYQTTGIKPYSQSAIGIILGTGCGGGIIINENIIRGRNGGGGEIGHTVLFADGHPCYCGANGCAEQYLSGPAIEASYSTRIYNDIKTRPSSKEIFELYDIKEPQALAVIKQYKRNLIKFLTNLSNIFDPDYFVLGGGVSTQDIIYQELSEELDRHTFIPESNPVILKNKLGDSSGVIGATLLPLIKLEKR